MVPGPSTLSTTDLAHWPHLRRLEPSLLARVERFQVFSLYHDNHTILWTTDNRAYHVVFHSTEYVITDAPYWGLASQVIRSRAITATPTVDPVTLYVVLTPEGQVLASEAGSTQTRPTPVIGNMKLLRNSTPEMGHILGVDLDGFVWAWGNNARGQLGLGDFHHRLKPTRVEQLCRHPVIDLRCHGTVTVALTSHGKLYVWGEFRQVVYARGRLENQGMMWNSPVRIPTPSGWFVISTEVRGTKIFAVTSDGRVYQHKQVTRMNSKAWSELIAPEPIVELHGTTGSGKLIMEARSGRLYVQRKKFCLPTEITSLADLYLFESIPNTPGIVSISPEARKSCIGFNDPQNCDFWLSLDGYHRCYVYRDVLKRKSPFFARLWERDPQNQECLRHLPYAVSFDYLRYLYTGHLRRAADFPFEFLKLSLEVGDDELHQRAVEGATTRLEELYRMKPAVFVFYLEECLNGTLRNFDFYPPPRMRPDASLRARLVRYLSERAIEFEADHPQDEDERALDQARLVGPRIRAIHIFRP